MTDIESHLLCQVYVFIREKDLKYRSVNGGTFVPPCEVTETLIDNDGQSYGLTVDYPIKNLAIIPVEGGVLCLINREGGFNEEMLPSEFEAQLIVNNYRLTHQLFETKTFSKEHFLANMSHEIRTPLNGVVGYTQLLFQTELSHVQKNYLVAMNQCSIQLMEIINDILDYSKLVAGRLKLNTSYFTIQSIVDAVNSAMRNKIKERRQKCTWILHPKLPRYIVADKQKVIQVIVNLVSNSVKFTPIGGWIKIKMSLKDSKHYHQILVSVEDNGVGISKENQTKLFTAFVQLQKVHKTSNGLGLAICKRLVELMGGHIWVTSALGKGSNFTFSFDYSPYQQRQNYNLKGKYILVVDDRSENRILLNELLFEWGVKPVICASPSEALKQLSKYDFSLALLDICMPELSGIDLAKQFKEEKPTLPLVALSSLDELIDTTSFEEVIEKPIVKERLLEVIVTILHRDNDIYLSESSPESSVSTDRSPESINILVAEDISYNRIMLVKMLKSLGYTTVSVAGDGQTCLQSIKHNQKLGQPFEILLLDLKMPDVDGFKVIERLKKEKIPVEIIITTASVLEEDREKCRELGIKYFLTKPIQMKQLREVLYVCQG